MKLRKRLKERVIEKKGTNREKEREAEKKENRHYLTNQEAKETDALYNNQSIL